MKKKVLYIIAGIIVATVVGGFLLLQFSPRTALNLAISAELGRAGLEIKSVRIRDHKIVYAVGGPKDKPALLLIHGFAADKSNWIRFSRHLTADYRVFAPDLAGHGESTRSWKQSYDLGFQVDVLRSFAAKMGLKQFHIAGNSMGGNISGLYAARYPEQIITLGLLNTGGITSAKPSEHRRIMRTTGRNSLLVNDIADFDRLLRFSFVVPPSIPGPVKAYFARRAVKNRAFNDKIYKDLMGPKKAPLEPHLGKISARTLVIWGDTDRIIDVSAAQVLRRKLKQSKIVIMKKCGHAPMIERPEETARHYRAFLEVRRADTK